MDLGITLLSAVVGVVNAVVALATGYVAWLTYKHTFGGHDGDDHHSCTPKTRSGRGDIRPGGERHGRVDRFKGKFRRVVSAYLTGDELPVVPAGK